MTIHDDWASSTETAPASGELRMDELTAHQLADELTTLASSMFGLLQPHPGSNPAAAGSAAEARTASPEAPQIQDPASVVSVAIPVEPVVAVPVPESWTPDEVDAEAAEATEDEPAVTPAVLDVPALAVPSLAVPEVPEIADLPSAPPVLSLVEPLEVPDGLDKLDQREPETPAPRQSMALLNEIAFLDD
jgi:hypothetical protein